MKKDKVPIYNSRVSGCKRLLLMGCVCLLVEAPAFGGFILQGEGFWQSMSIRNDSATPLNYYGYGGRAQGGYSIGRVVDLKLFASFAPMSGREATLETRPADLSNYGFATGIRFAKSVFIGISGGQQEYVLNARRFPEEVDGHFVGPFLGFTLGSYAKLFKIHHFQLSIDLGYGRLVEQDADEPRTINIDSFSVGVGYMMLTSG